jgi:4-amino-4-deoxy-L-arabinose transferase-like glycosyltransferase
MALFLAPHNDEIIYTQYAQIINQNWTANKYVSVGGSFSGDYKEPLQYWLTSISVNWWTNPLWGVRLWSIIIGCFGFVSWLCLIKKIFGNRVVGIFGLLYLFSGYYLYFDSIGLAEVYIYSGGAIFFYLSYQWLTKRHWYYLFLASIIFALALLTKNSAWLILFLAVFLPIILLVRGESNKRFYWSGGWFYVFLLSNIFIGKFVYNLVVGKKFETIRLASPTFNFILSWSELSKLPINLWLVNLRFYLTQVVSSDGLFFLWLIILFLVVYLVGRDKQKFLWSSGKTLLVLGGWWLASFTPMVVLMRTTYFRHYGMWWLIFYLLIAFCLTLLIEALEKITRNGLFVKVVVVLGSVLILNQVYSSFDPLFKFGQTDAGEQEVTDLWMSPLGINDLIAYLKTLPSATVLFDDQWGHFSVDISVFRNYYPNLRLIALESEDGRNLMMSSTDLRGQKVYIIFDTYWLDRGNSGPPLEQIAFNQKLCGKKKEIEKKYRQKIEDSKFVICEVQ